MQPVKTDAAPAAIGPYSQAIVSDGLIFASGQIPLDPATGKIVAGGIAEQTTRVMENVKAVLAAAGTDLDHVVKTTCFLQDLATLPPSTRSTAAISATRRRPDRLSRWRLCRSAPGSRSR